MSETILGIDLGTTNSLVGAVDAGFPILFADAAGSRITPSVVHYPAGDAAPTVGAAALRMWSVEPGRTVRSVKRKIGETAKLRVEDRELSPEEVSAEILKHLKTVAERALEHEVSQAVITVPAYFNDGQRNATKRAAEMAGLSVARILNEPTAAALAYGLDRLGERSKVAVYDLGGGTFDVSILELRGDVFEVISTAGDTRLGGDDFDAALVHHLVDTAGLDRSTLSPVAHAKISEAATAAKIALSTDGSHDCAVPFLEGAQHLEETITRAEFEALIEPLVQRTATFCRRALADAKLEPGDLDAVVLVGGSTRVPRVRAFVAEFFGQEPNTSQHPDEAVALGAVIQAGILSGAMRDVVLLDITPLSLGIETFGGLMNVIIPRNTTIPTKAGELFTNAVANQPAMKINVLQGERELAKDNWALGELELAFEKGAKGSARVGVEFRIDADGILTVLARDTIKNRDEILEIRDSAVDVGDEEVEKMIAESVDHAFDDMSARVFTEAKLKSEELLPAVEQAMEQAGDAIGDEARAEIDAKVAAVNAALTSGDANQLKPANAELDAATETLAAVLVERAMEKALERRGLG